MKRKSKISDDKDIKLVRKQRDAWKEDARRELLNAQYWRERYETAAGVKSE